MAQQALGAGTTVPRKRALFGLLDADGWAWASVKAVRLARHHHPDPRLHPRPRLLPHGRPDGRPRRPRLVADQPLPARERDAAVPGAGRRGRPVGDVAARARPARSRGPTAPSSSSGRSPLHRRLRRHDRAVDGLRRADGRDRQLRQVGRGPAAARAADRRERRVRRRQHLRHRRHGRGRRADRPRPSSLTPDGTTGELGEWTTRRRPDAARGARRGRRGRHRRRAAPRRRVATPTGPVATDVEDAASTRRRRCRSGPRSRPLDVPQTDATAAIVGDFVWLYGGSDANGPVGAVQRGTIGQAGRRGPARNPDAGKVSRLGVSDPVANLPAPAHQRGGWAANGAIYVAGGNDGSGAAERALLGGRRPTTATSPSGSTSTSATCRSRPEGGAAVVTGPDAIIVGGTTDRGRRRRRSVRANIAPQSPVLPARPGRRDGPRPQDRGRDRPAARLPERGRRRHRQLHHPDPDRLGLRPQGAGAGADRQVLRRR